MAQITDISRLQSALTWWEYADYAATLVVFIGVLGELLAEFTNVFKTKDNKVREKRVTLIFTLVLLVGLAGELTALVQTSNVTSKITEILRNDIAAAYKSAADATIEAGKANERSKELENQNLKLARELEEEKQKRLEIERILAPRFLTSRERATLVASLRLHAGAGISVVRLGDAEAGQYADQIIGAFVDAKWHVHLSYIGTLSPPVYGVLCKEPSQESDPVGRAVHSLGEAVHSSFFRAGIPHVLEIIHSGPSLNEVQLLIGLKPLNVKPPELERSRLRPH
jgi:hypothetical protein